MTENVLPELRKAIDVRRDGELFAQAVLERRCEAIHRLMVLTLNTIDTVTVRDTKKAVSLLEDAIERMSELRGSCSIPLGDPENR